jgi:uncharacterized RDD family membrane protein YckC
MARRAGGRDERLQAQEVALGLAVVCARVGSAVGRVALLPVHVVAGSPIVGSLLGRAGEGLAREGQGARVRGREQLRSVTGKVVASPELEGAVDQALAGPLPEALVRSVVDRRIVQRVSEQVLESADLEAAVEAALQNDATERLVEETLASPGLERLVMDAVESRLASELTDHVIQSTNTQRLVEEIAASPAVRKAVARQTTSLAGELTAGLSRLLGRFDDATARTVQGWLRRQPPQPLPSGPGARYGGLGARGTAFAIDIGLSLVIYLLGAALVALVASLVGGLRPSWLAEALAAAGFALVVGAYLVLFWRITGQTPGMRAMRLRLDAGSGEPPGLVRSLVRLVGTGLAIVPMFAGFYPVPVDRRRRALQDYLAGTVVVYDAEALAGDELVENDARSTVLPGAGAGEGSPSAHSDRDA